MPTFNDKKASDVQKHKSIWIAEQMWQSAQDVLYCNGSFYQWEGRIYKKIDDMDWIILMTKRFPAFDESSPAKQKEILEVYRMFAKTPIEEFNKEDGLCLQNKYVNLDDLNVYEHDKKRINTILIPYDYDPIVECPLWITTIADILEGNNNKIRTLQEFFGYCLTKQTKYEKALFLTGEGGTGKSVILDCLLYMLSVKNVSFISLRHFSDSVRLQSIENKMVNICTEISKKVEDYEEMFKKIVTGEYIQVSPKYIPQYDIKPHAKLIFAVNQWPHIDDQSSAFFRRMLILTLNKIYPEEMYDRDLKEKLKSETQGILNWALIGLKRLREQKGFYMTEEMKEDIREVRNLNNPVALWAEENIRIEKGKEIAKKEVYQKYSVWCQLNGYKPLGHAKFSMELHRIFKSVTKKNVRSSLGDRPYVWPNLTWVLPESVPSENQAVWDD